MSRVNRAQQIRALVEDMYMNYFLQQQPWNHAVNVSNPDQLTLQGSPGFSYQQAVGYKGNGRYFQDGKRTKPVQSGP